MNKLFRPKCLRRVLLCLALLFPIVYLCGGLFFGLAGAHGIQLWSEKEDDSTSITLSDFNQYLNIDDNGIFINGNENTWAINSYYSFNSSFVYSLYGFPSTNFNIRFYYYDDSYNFINYSQFNRVTNGNVDLPENTTYFAVALYGSYVNPSVILSNFSSEVIENLSAISFSDFIFSQPFASNNFITSLGKDLINGSTKGFAPMNDLFRFINSNMLHFESTDGLAVFGLGYVYYAVNVLIIYEILILAVKLIMLPLKAVDLFDKKEDI